MLFMKFLSVPEADSHPMVSLDISEKIERLLERYLTVLIFVLSASSAAAHGLAGTFKFGVDWGIPDMNFFAGPALSLTGGDLDSVYSSWTNQAAPMYLLFLGLVIRIAKFFNSPLVWIAWQAILGSVVLLTGAALAKRLVREIAPNSCWRPWAPLFTVLALLVLDIPHFYYQQGHWAHVPVLISWIAMAVLVQTDTKKSAVLAGVAFGSSIIWEPLGPLGLVILILAPKLIRAIQACLVATFVSALVWLPFRFSGSFAMGEIRWWIHKNTIWDYLGFQDIPWTVRIIQGCLVMAVAGGAAWFFRRRATNPFLVSLSIPSVIFAARIAWDNIFVSYYLIVLIIAAAVVLPALVISQSQGRALLLALSTAIAPIGALSMPAPLIFLTLASVWTFIGVYTGRYRKLMGNRP